MQLHNARGPLSWIFLHLISVCIQQLLLLHAENCTYEWQAEMRWLGYLLEPHFPSRNCHCYS